VLYRNQQGSFEDVTRTSGDLAKAMTHVKWGVGFADFDNRVPWARAHGWLKLASFAKPLHDIEGPTLFIDLDVVIVGELDSFFDVPGEFVVIREWDKRDGTGNTSVRFTAGAHVDALEYFKQHSDEARNTYRNERYITTFLAGQGKMSFWPESGAAASSATVCVRMGSICSCRRVFRRMRASLPFMANPIHPMPSPVSVASGIAA
jgi:hypothetical protein